ncbi:hypothetical protein BST36_19560 [Mycolicibacterium moriokaense]|uniref:Secreted protein n=1 Tax=Mycolicibacterium moriokaense TaxID=39691 RepID=A0AAD1H766_9MYCO|nr:hypothetical protein [Mycolicibacterium moriokaense]MCV7039019.1 hypothetical protein [Mycolicibacterium moriokaense]ORB20450.1 hypothetical protein BST36_19560 [Mycolicibacterium moriokaense]BBW99919.1 hypothetical protein MMOR_08560 [Mycolicibacterium moriokaense]
MIRSTAATTALVAVAVALAGTAWADDRLDGDFTFINGPISNTWTITTQCNPEVTCGGTISSSTGLIEQINRVAGGPWIVERTDVPNGRVCPDGSTGPADLMYSFDPATLVGALSFRSKPGVCGDPDWTQGENPISLVPQ